MFLAVTSLALQLSNKCKGSSKRFRCLGNDLTVFHLVLKDTQQYLSHPRLRHIRIECESLAEEIDDMLSEHAERNRLERFCHAVAKDPPGDILELQRRLQWTVTVLTLFVT